MTIQEMLERSEKLDGFCRGYSVIRPDDTIFGTMRYEDHMLNELTGDVIYVVSPDNLPKEFPGTDIYHFLLAGVTEEKSLNVQNSIRRRTNLLITSAGVSEAVNRMETILFMERKIETSIRRITEALFTSGLKKMIAVGAGQARCPVLLAKNDGHIIERNRTEGYEKLGDAFNEWWESLEAADELVTLAETSEMDEATRAHYDRIPNGKEFFLPDSDVLVISVPLRVNHIRVGYLFGFTIKEELPALEAELLNRLAMITGDELQRHNEFQTNQRQRYINFMWMLLEGKYPNMQEIDKALDELGFSYDGNCMIALLHVLNENDEKIYVKDMLKVLSTQIVSKLPGILWTIHQDELVLLLDLGEAQTPGEYIMDVFRRISAENDISIGLSESQGSLANARQLYWQAKEAAEYGHEYLNQTITGFDMIAHFSMFRLAQREMDLAVFIDRDLRNLFFSGKENLQEYCNTMYYYLKYGGVTKTVAEQTHMHPNTVRYRIDKLQQMGFDLTGGNSVMRLMLSFEILRYLKLFNPAE